MSRIFIGLIAIGAALGVSVRTTFAQSQPSQLAASPAAKASPAAQTATSPAAQASPNNIYTLPPVVVSATRTDITPQTSTSYLRVFTNDDVKQTPSLVLDDALRVIPGFNTFRRSSSTVTAPADDPEAQGVTLRGVGPGGASRALVLLDGIPETDAFGGWIYWDALPLAGIDRVEVVEGGGSDLWGSGAEGGVINIISKQPANANNIQVEGSYGNRNTTQDNLSGDYILGPAKISLEQDFFNTNGWDIVRSGFRGPIDHSASSMHTLSTGRIELDDPGTGITTFLRGSFYQEYRDLGTAFQSSATTRGFVNGGASYDDHIGDVFNASVYAHLTTYHQNFSMSDFAQTVDMPAQTQRVPSSDEGGFFTWTRTFFQQHTVAAGGDFRLIQGTDYDNFFNTTGTAIDLRRKSSGDQQFGGAYVEDLFRPFEQLEIDASVRGDIFANDDGKTINTRLTPTCTEDGLPCGPTSTKTFSNQLRTATSPRLGVRYDITKWFEFRGSLYEAYRAPTLAELYRQSSVEDLVLLPNPNLKPEFLYGADGGFVFKLIPGLTAGWTGFWNNLFDPINNVVTASFPNGSDAERTRENLGRARIRGYEGEFTYDFPWINWYEWSTYHPQLSLSADYLRSEATLTSSPPDITLVGRRLALVPWDTLSINLRYSDSMLGEFWAQEEYQGKQWEDSDNHDLQPSYWVTNLSWSHAIPHPSNASWLDAATMYVKVQNVFNNQYIIDLGGDIPKIGTPLMVVGGMRVPLDF